MSADILRSIAGIEIFPLVSLLLFTTVFGVVLLWAWRADPVRLGQLAAMPLDEPVPSDPVATGESDSSPRRPA
jgi:cytochrome c oxidase cbb3-type subunit IV